MNIKKIISCIMAILAAILVAVTLTACGSCVGDIEDVDTSEQDENEGEFEVGGSDLGAEIPIPEDEQ